MERTGAYERVLVASAAFLDRGWFPPAADCEELADLHEEHERLLDSCAEALNRVGNARVNFERVGQDRSQALRTAIAEGKSPAHVKLPEPDDTAVREARRVYEAACDVLEQFVARAQAEIAERAPQIRANLGRLVRDAHAKRAEARRLLDQADRLEAQPRRLSNWLDRYTGDSMLGPIAYETLGIPVREPVPELFEEIAGLPPATVIDVGNDEISDEEMEAMSRA